MADTYDVVGQRQTTTLGGAGRFEDVIEVTIKTKPSGIVLQEMVPLRDYSDIDTVRSRLAQRAQLAEDVHNL